MQCNLDSKGPRTDGVVKEVSVVPHADSAFSIRVVPSVTEAASPFDDSDERGGVAVGGERSLKDL